MAQIVVDCPLEDKSTFNIPLPSEWRGNEGKETAGGKEGNRENKKKEKERKVNKEKKSEKEKWKTVEDSPGPVMVSNTFYPTVHIFKNLKWAYS